MSLNDTHGCPNASYIPTVSEYSQALGNYGIAFKTVGGLLSLLLYGLFFQQIWFTFANTHRAYRRHIYWLTSIYPTVTLMSTLAMVVPRAHEICSAVKITYMSIGVSHFADLTVQMFGSESLMLAEVSNRTLQLNMLPLCCCFTCLPRPPASKWSVRLTFVLVYQMPVTQFMYFFLEVFLGMAEVNNDATTAVLTVLNFASFLSGVYALNIICTLVSEDLKNCRYEEKSLALKILILTTKLQAFLFNVLGYYDVFPCHGDYISSLAYEDTLENSILILEMLLFGFFSYYMYSKPEFKEFPGDKEVVANFTTAQVGPNTTELTIYHYTTSEGQQERPKSSTDAISKPLDNPAVSPPPQLNQLRSEL